MVLFAPPAHAADEQHTATLTFNGYVPASGTPVNGVAMTLSGTSAQSGIYTVSISQAQGELGNTLDSSEKGLIVIGGTTMTITLADGNTFKGVPDISYPTTIDRGLDGKTFTSTPESTIVNGNTATISFSGGETEACLVQSIELTYTAPATTGDDEGEGDDNTGGETPEPEPTLYHVTLVQPANGTLTANPEIPQVGVEAGFKTVITATPAPKYRLDKIMAGDVQISNGADYTVSGDATITATFIQDYWNVTVTEPSAEEGTLKISPTVPTTGDLAGTLANGTVITITATPKAGYYTLEGIYVNEEKIEGNTYTINGKDVTISAKFTPVVFDLTLSGSDTPGLTTTGKGTIDVSPETGIKIGTNLDITVTPEVGYSAKSLTVNGKPVQLTESRAAATAGPVKYGKYTVVAGDVKSGKGELIFAPVYEAQTFEVTWGQEGTAAGNVSVQADGKSLTDKAKVAYNTVLTINVTPEGGNKVKSITVNGTYLTIVEGNTEYTYTVKGDTKIEVTFEKDTRPIALDIMRPTNGTIIVTRDGKELDYSAKVDYGETITITATADAEYKLKSITVSPDKGPKPETSETSPMTYTVPDKENVDIASLKIDALFEPIKNCTVTWSSPSKGGTMKVYDSNDKPLKNVDKVAQDDAIIVVCKPEDENFVPVLTLNGKDVATPEKGTDGSYTYSIEIKNPANKLAVTFVDGRQVVTIATQTQNGITVTLYSDPERKTKISQKSSSNLTNALQQDYELRDGQGVYATVTGATGKTVTVKTGQKGNVDNELQVTDYKFEFTAVQGLNVVTTWKTAPTQYTFQYSVDKGSEGLGQIIVSAGGESIATDQAVKLNAGTEVTVSIKPIDGYRIKTVTGTPTKDVTYSEGSSTSKTTRTFTFKISGNVNIRASFEVIPEGTVTWTFGGKKPDATPGLATQFAGFGSLTMTIDGADVLADPTETYRDGTEATYTLTAADEYYINTLTINGATPADFNKELRPSSFECTQPIKALSTTKPYTSVNAVNATFLHHKLTLKYKINSEDVVPSGIVTAYYRTYKTVNGKTTYTDAKVANGANVDTKAQLVFKANPTAGYKVTSMTVTPPSGETQTGNFELNTAGKPTAVYAVGPIEAPGNNDVEGNVAEYTINLQLELLPVAITINAPTGSNSHGTIEVTDVTVNKPVASKDEVKVGHELRIIAKANTGYQIQSITINGKAQELESLNAVNATLTGVKVTGPMTIAVTWEKQKFLVSVAPTGYTPGTPGTPTVGTTGKSEASFTNGSKTTVNANCATGYEVKAWYLNGDKMTQTVGTGANATVKDIVSPSISVTVTDKAQSYLVEYKLIEYNQHYVKWDVNNENWKEEPGVTTPTVWGSVEMLFPDKNDIANWPTYRPTPASRAGEPAIEKDGIIFWPYVVTVKATPTATPAGKYYFDYWSIGGRKVSEETTYSYAGDNNTIVTANFGRCWTVQEADEEVYGGKFTITLLGTDDALPPVITTAGTYVRNNGKVGLKAIPDKGYKFACFVVNGKEWQRLNTEATVDRTLTITEDTKIGVRFYNPAGIEDVIVGEGSADETVQWFTVQGRYLGTEQPTEAGVYIRRIGDKATKILIK
ncbi:MAG: hypothetical protein NC342_08580 [Pseudoflavonifractor sp.]|nr:hypothetical protein [Alloprevotella sp.]MCM1117576.1 hypothetical protein [Pseudoflavonifractor sp.]